MIKLNITNTFRYINCISEINHMHSLVFYVSNNREDPSIHFMLHPKDINQVHIFFHIKETNQKSIKTKPYHCNEI